MPRFDRGAINDYIPADREFSPVAGTDLLQEEISVDLPSRYRAAVFALVACPGFLT